MRRTPCFLGAVTAALMLAGCVPFPEPNPEPLPGESAAASALAPGGTASTGGAIHNAQAGDTVFSLAERYRVPLRSLIDINRLQPPYRLIPGQPLLIPKPREHRVAQGETVYGISRRYGVDMSALVKLNGVVPPYTIRVGETLRIPAPIESASTAAAAASAQPVPPPPTAGASPPQPTAGVPAAPVGVEAEELDAPATPAPLPAPPAAAQPPTQPAAAVASIVPKPAPRASSDFLWPVDGKIVSSFGPKKGGLHNDGINIAAPRGTPVRAAENGIVAYAGNELRGFGNLLLIKHADGWTSAYAHNEELLVRRGDQIRRGQVIAKVGSTGSVTIPQLHFELREGAEAVDPLKLLSRQQAGL